MANIRNKVLLPPWNVNSVKSATNSLAKQQHVRSVQSTNTKIKIHKHLSHVKNVQQQNIKIYWVKPAAKITFVHAQMEGPKQLVLTVLHMIQKFVLDVPPVKCCCQTEAASNAEREKHLLVLQLLAWTVLLVDIKIKHMPRRTDANYAGWASTVISQVKHHKQEPAKNATKVDGRPPCLRSRVLRVVEENTILKLEVLSATIVCCALQDGIQIMK